jgi:hypothetical protein
VKRGDNITLTRKVKSHGSGPDVIGPKPPKPPRMTIADLAKEMREGFKELKSDVQGLKSDVQSIDARLTKVENILERNNLH